MVLFFFLLFPPLPPYYLLLLPSSFDLELPLVLTLSSLSSLTIFFLFLFLPSSLSFHSPLLPLSLLPHLQPTYSPSLISFRFWSSSSSSSLPIYLLIIFFFLLLLILNFLLFILFPLPSFLSSPLFHRLFLSCIRHVFFLFFNLFLLCNFINSSSPLLAYFLLLPPSCNLELPLVHPLISLLPPLIPPLTSLLHHRIPPPPSLPPTSFFLEIQLLPVPPLLPHPSQSFLDSTSPPFASAINPIVVESNRYRSICFYCFSLLLLLLSHHFSRYSNLNGFTGAMNFSDFNTIGVTACHSP